MKQANQQIIDNWNKIADSDWYNSYRTDDVISAIIQNPASAFHPTVFALLKEALKDFQDKKVLVPSSGDNHAVFAFHLLGARVSSSDISQRQLDNAQIIAKKHDWDIAFQVDNTMTLETAADNAYDLVYTSNGVFVWIDDLQSMFSNIYRVLKTGGIYVSYDIHPFTRPFAYADPANQTSVIIKKPYDHIDLGLEKHWRMQDLLNAVINSGLSVNHIEEMYPEFGTYWFESTGGREGLSEEQLKNLYDWKHTPLAAIPAWLSVMSDKK
ncbi:MAG: class I SAM-dependent methyltransferase [Clostridia bacterium]|nr:class I SAM-dependent methyltransferase [Clostridia bacterium]